MRATWFLKCGLVLLGATTSSGGAQQPARGAVPPIRPLGAIVARSTAPIRGVRAVRALSDGRLLLYEGGAGRVLLVDSTLASARVVVDSASARPGFASGVLLQLCGDSTLYLDGSSSTALVLDPMATIVRRIPISPGQVAASGMLTAPARVTADCAGRLFYRAPGPVYLSMVAPTFVGDTILRGPDSIPLLRYDLATRRTDTALMLRAPRVRQAVTRFERGGRGRPALDPVPAGGDDWLALGNGTIAVVRSRDYHVDWLHRDGSTMSGPRVPHAWTLISTAQKIALIDSLRRAADAARAASLYPTDSARYDSLALVAAANPDAVTGPNGKPMPLGPRPVRLMFVGATDLPDTLPPFLAGNAFADSDDNIWVRALPQRAAGPALYDVLDKRGALVDRVELPPGAALLGVARGRAILRMPERSGPPIAVARLR